MDRVCQSGRFLQCQFPGQPEVRDITATEYITLPGRVHSREDGPKHVTQSR